jgi:hypothetical protein
MGGGGDACYNPENIIVNYHNNKSEIVSTKVSFSTGFHIRINHDQGQKLFNLSEIKII